MDGQYRRIKDFEEVLWDPDSPVLVERMRLAHDRIYGTNVLQITFRNTSELNIYALSIRITLKDEAGVPIYEEVNYNYFGMEVQSCRTFGGSDDIIVESEAINFDITVLRADLSDGEVFRGALLLKKMSEPLPLETLGEFEESFQERLVTIQPKLKPVCAPEEREKYWRCVCTRLYPNAIERCPSCRLKASVLLDIIPQLKQEKRMREIEEARLEKLRQEEEERRQEEERLRQEEEERIRQEEERIRREEEERRQEEERKRKEEEERERLKRKKRIIKLASSAAVLVILIAGALIWLLPKRSEPDEGSEVLSESPEPTEEIVIETPEPVEEPVVDTPPAEENTDGRKPLVVLGADLDPEETRTIWRLFNTTAEELGSYDTYTVNAQQTHMFMDLELGRNVVENRALASMLVLPAEEGSGVHISMYNINGDEEMFLEAFDIVKMTDVDVIVAAPAASTGASALTGFYFFGSGSTRFVGTGIGHAVSKSIMNVRSGPSTSYEICGSVPTGNEVEVLEIVDNNWYKIVWEYDLSGFAYTSNTGNRFYDYTPNPEPAEETSAEEAPAVETPAE